MCHQSGYPCGEKSDMRLATTSKGKAMSMANEARKPSVSDGTRLLPMIQKPSRPMPRSASTACKVVTKTLTLFPFYMRQSALTSSMTAFAVFFLPHTALRQKPATLPQTLRKPSNNRAYCWHSRSNCRISPHVTTASRTGQRRTRASARSIPTLSSFPRIVP